MCRTDDLKTPETDFNDLWRLIVRDLRNLEENGICLNDGAILKGTVTYLGFDNLGANQSLGFVESFGATYFCRFCTASKRETETMIREDKKVLRTIPEYQGHLDKVADSSKIDFKQTRGVKRRCSLNDLKYFHSLTNKSVDIMHDINEGAIPPLLQLIFNYCIAEKVFTEDWLRKRIQFHDFGVDRKNSPSALNLKKSNLNQSATQLLCLFRNIGFILSEFEENETLRRVWGCVESLQTVTQIAYSYDIHEDDLNQFTVGTTRLLEGN